MSHIQIFNGRQNVVFHAFVYTQFFKQQQIEIRRHFTYISTLPFLHLLFSSSAYGRVWIDSNNTINSMHMETSRSHVISHEHDSEPELSISKYIGSKCWVFCLRSLAACEQLRSFFWFLISAFLCQTLDFSVLNTLSARCPFRRAVTCTITTVEYAH